MLMHLEATAWIIICWYMIYNTYTRIIYIHLKCFPLPPSKKISTTLQDPELVQRDSDFKYWRNQLSMFPGYSFSNAYASIPVSKIKNKQMQGQGVQVITATLEAQGGELPFTSIPDNSERPRVKEKRYPKVLSAVKDRPCMWGPRGKIEYVSHFSVYNVLQNNINTSHI